MPDIKQALKSIPGLVPLVRYLRGAPYPMPREWVLHNMPHRSIGAEIGVHEGDFAARIIKEVNPCALHLIDPWEHIPDYESAWYGGEDVDQSVLDRRFESVKTRFNSQIENEEVFIHRSPSAEASKSFTDEYFDWVYIDGNHQYEYVFEDLQKYYPKVKSGGLLMGDDYGVEGWWDNGVQKAVDDFVKERDLDLDTVESQFIIKKP